MVLKLTSLRVETVMWHSLSSSRIRCLWIRSKNPRFYRRELLQVVSAWQKPSLRCRNKKWAICLFKQLKCRTMKIKSRRKRISHKTKSKVRLKAYSKNSPLRQPIKISCWCWPSSNTKMSSSLKIKVWPPYRRIKRGCLIQTGCGRETLGFSRTRISLSAPAEFNLQTLLTVCTQLSSQFQILTELWSWTNLHHPWQTGHRCT